MGTAFPLIYLIALGSEWPLKPPLLSSLYDPRKSEREGPSFEHGAGGVLVGSGGMRWACTTRDCQRRQWIDQHRLAWNTWPGQEPVTFD